MRMKVLGVVERYFDAWNSNDGDAIAGSSELAVV
jgi:hypothetical protein